MDRFPDKVGPLLPFVRCQLPLTRPALLTFAAYAKLRADCTRVVPDKAFRSMVAELGYYLGTFNSLNILSKVW